MPQLDSQKIPAALASILPMAEKWGIGDDFEREIALDKATTTELQEVARCLDEVDDPTLVEWLNGPESRRKPPSDEYLAVTCLIMAVHSAKVKLKKRQHS